MAQIVGHHDRYSARAVVDDRSDEGYALLDLRETWIDFRLTGVEQQVHAFVKRGVCLAQIIEVDMKVENGIGL